MYLVNQWTNVCKITVQVRQTLSRFVQICFHIQSGQVASVFIRNAVFEVNEVCWTHIYRVDPTIDGTYQS